MAKKKENKDQHTAKMNQFMVGGTDDVGNPITCIYYAADEYVIYGVKTSISKYSIQIFINSKKRDDTSLVDKYNKISKNFTELRGILYKVTNGKSFIRTRIAYLVALALDGEVQNANDGLEELIKEINRNYKKLIGIKFSFLITILLITLVLSMISIGIYNKSILCGHPKLHFWIYAINFGVIGCFLSASFNRNKLTFDIDFSKNIYIFFALERCFVSIFCSILIVLAIKGKLLFGEYDSFYFYMFIGTIAGFSETLIPSIFEKFDKKAESE